jgi:hypothetical protein
VTARRRRARLVKDLAMSGQGASLGSCVGLTGRVPGQAAVDACSANRGRPAVHPRFEDLLLLWDSSMGATVGLISQGAK